jgi:alpha-tubulin suppressor-like RCC1 family protein
MSRFNRPGSRARLALAVLLVLVFGTSTSSPAASDSHPQVFGITSSSLTTPEGVFTPTDEPGTLTVGEQGPDDAVSAVLDLGPMEATFVVSTPFGPWDVDVEVHWTGPGGDELTGTFNPETGVAEFTGTTELVVYVAEGIVWDFTVCTLPATEYTLSTGGAGQPWDPEVGTMGLASVDLQVPSAQGRCDPDTIEDSLDGFFGDQGQLLELQLVDETAAPVTGTVIDADANPIGGALVGVFGPLDGWTPTAMTTTDGAGAYDFTALPVGEYKVVAVPSDPSSGPAVWFGGATRQTATPITTTTGTPVDGVDLVFAVGTIGGTVTEGGDLPLEGARVELWGAGDDWFPRATVLTDETGGYLLAGVAEGDYHVRVRPPDESPLVAAWYPGAPSRLHAQVVSLADGAQVQGVDITLVMPASIGGTATLGGEALAGVGVQVFVAGQTWLPVASTSTGLDGSYLLEGLAPGSYQIRFIESSSPMERWYDDADIRADATPVDLAAGELRSDLDVAFPVTADWVQVATGSWHSCALSSSGTVNCWGRNAAGQLGDGTGQGSTNPVEVLGLDDVRQVSAGEEYTCAVRWNGEVYCWGSNYGGRLGDGTTTNRWTPVPVDGIDDAVAVAAGLGLYEPGHTCALLDDGGVRCWGTNTSGQLGDGTTTSSLTPVEVVGVDTAVQVVAGYYRTCAVLEDGTLTCWGAGASPTPTAVEGLGPVTQVSMSMFHRCAVMVDATVRCWGGNGAGQLGDGTTTSSFDEWVTVNALDDAVEVATGSAHTCARRTDGTVRCWGANSAGQLGNGTTAGSLLPVDVVNLDGVLQLDAGAGDEAVGHSCAVRDDARVLCWGSNNLGQLGDGTTTNRTEPTFVF